MKTVGRVRDRLLKAATDFCKADAQVQLARSQWREINTLHGYEGVCCLSWDDEEAGVNRGPLPRSKWCENCIRIMADAVDYQDALWKRRSAKTRMLKAHRDLELLTANYSTRGER